MRKIESKEDERRRHVLDLLLSVKKLRPFAQKLSDGSVLKPKEIATMQILEKEIGGNMRQLISFSPPALLTNISEGVNQIIHRRSRGALTILDLLEERITSLLGEQPSRTREYRPSA